MSYLLDTNVISELIATKPNNHVVQWLKRVPDEALYVSVLTFGEIRKGIEKLADQKRKQTFKLWLEYDLPAWFGSRVLSIDHHVADKWGRLLGQTKRTLAAVDSLLVATALHFDLSLVTRNEKDFKDLNLEIINPWNQE